VKEGDNSLSSLVSHEDKELSIDLMEEEQQG
jgi:hypothetical protein